MSTQTDRQTDKSSRWAFTAYEEQWSLFETMPPGVAEWGWNAEVCPKSNRKHYQGYLRLTAQQRFAWLRKLLPGVHIEICKNWDALKLYCQKEETRMEGTQPTHQMSSYMTHYQYRDEVAKTICAIIESSGHKPTETPKDKILRMVDEKVRQDIMKGRRYACDIAQNPQWERGWNLYAKELIISYSSINATQTCSTPRQEDSPWEEPGRAQAEPGQEPNGSN